LFYYLATTCFTNRQICSVRAANNRTHNLRHIIPCLENFIFRSLFSLFS
jgi:hypothetical protein